MLRSNTTMLTCREEPLRAPEVAPAKQTGLFRRWTKRLQDFCFVSSAFVAVFEIFHLLWFCPATGTTTKALLLYNEDFIVLGKNKESFFGVQILKGLWLFQEKILQIQFEIIFLLSFVFLYFKI